MKNKILIVLLMVCLLFAAVLGAENISENLSLSNDSAQVSDIVPVVVDEIPAQDVISNESLVVQDEVIKSPIESKLVIAPKSDDLDKVVKKDRLNKLSKDLRKLKLNETAKIIVQKLNGISYKEVDGQQIVSELNDSNVVKVWPDRQTELYLDKSAPLMGVSTLWNSGYKGQGVKVAILDTGIDFDHEMFVNTTIISKDFTGGNNSQDGNGHGTHVTGIIAGHGNYTGVAPNVTLVIGKVLTDGGYGQLSWLIDAINWAISQNVSVISMSLGATYTDAPEDLLSAPEVLAVENAVANGITVVIASGNCRLGCGAFTGVTTPGLARNAITVGAVNNSLSLAPFSSGSVIADYIKPDVVAPGVGICSSVVDGYACKSGTSMATPHIAGLAALMLSKNSSITPGQIKSIMIDASIDLGVAGDDTSYGYGFVNASRLDFGLNTSQLITYADVYQNTTHVIISSTFGLINSAVLDIYRDSLLVDELNYTSDFTYSFIPSVGSYSFKITAVGNNLSQIYTKSLDIKRVTVFSSSVVSGYNSSLYLRVFNENLSTTDVSLTTEEFGNYVQINQSQTFDGYSLFTLPVFFTVPGRHPVSIVVNGEEFNESVKVQYPVLSQSIDQIRVRII